jgi:hypothetical protein
MTKESTARTAAAAAPMAKDRRQRHTRILQRSSAERSEAIAELVRRDDQAGGGSGDGDQIFLGEADCQREERGAAEPGEAEGEHAGHGASVGKGGDREERADEHNG